MAHTRHYSANHERVRQARGPAREQKCAHCDNPALDWATVKGFDSKQEHVDPWTGFIPLCRSCHRAYDGNMPVFTGRRHKPESIEKIRQAKLGGSLTGEHREKISQALKGVPKSQKMRDNLGRSRRGMKFSDEARENMSAGQKKRWAENEIVHGTTTGYRRGCKCDDCRKAVTDAARARRERKAVKG